MPYSKNTINTITVEAYQSMMHVLYKKIGKCGSVPTISPSFEEKGNSEKIEIPKENIINCMQALDQLRRAAAITNSRDFTARVTTILKKMRSAFPDALNKNKDKLLTNDNILRTGRGAALWARGANRVDQAEAVMKALKQLRHLEPLANDNIALDTATKDAISAMKKSPIEDMPMKDFFYTSVI